MGGPQREAEKGGKGTPGRFGFSKKERITHPQDFKRVMRFGRRIPSKSFILFLQKNKDSIRRLGIVVKKEVGQAAYRNRIKRYCREFFRLNKHEIRNAFDIIILVRKGCDVRRYQEVEEELKKTLGRALR